MVVSGFPEAGRTRANWRLSVIKSRIIPHNHKNNNKTKNLRAPISPSNYNVTNLRTLRAAHKNAQQIYKWTRTFWYDSLHVQTVLKLKQARREVRHLDNIIRANSTPCPHNVLYTGHYLGTYAISGRRLILPKMPIPTSPQLGIAMEYGDDGIVLRIQSAKGQPCLDVCTFLRKHGIEPMFPQEQEQEFILPSNTVFRIITMRPLKYDGRRTYLVHCVIL